MSDSGQKSPQSVDLLITAVNIAGAALAHAKERELELEAQRPRVKSEAIARIMSLVDPQKGKEYSATAAEAIVGNDTVYALHLSDLRQATGDTIRAWGEFKAAELRALYAVNQALRAAEFVPLSAVLAKDHTVGLG